MRHWIRPTGTKITTNDEDVTVKQCESLGWKPDPAFESKKFGVDEVDEEETHEDAPNELVLVRGRKRKF